MHDEKVFGEHSYEVLTSSREGLQRQSEHFGTEQRHDTDGYNIIPLGYCTYRNRSDDGFFTFNVNNAFTTGIVSKFYPVFKFVGANSTFMTEYLNHSISNKKKLSILAVGTSQVVLSISALRSASFCIPHEKEQDKLASFIELLNIRIVKQRQLVELLKKYKRGVSKRFFDEIHNDQNCEAKQFSEVFELIQNNTFSRECLTDENTDVLNVHYGDILVKYGSVLDPDIDTVPFIKSGTDLSKFSGSSYLQDGDVIFADTAEDYTVGKMCEIINVSNRKILSGLHTMPFRPTSAFTPMYLGYYLNSAAFRTQILPMIQGAKVSSISKSEMKKTIMYIPSINRQKEIVNILNALDKRIIRTELILTELKEMKKGLLQNLFI